MESFKVLVAFALLVACAYAAQIPENQPLAPRPEGPLGQGPFPGAPGAPGAPGGPLEAGPAREKKQALFPYAYSAYPYGAYAYPYASAGYPYSYSYQYYDDGKYYPGKYDGKAYVRASPYYYPYYYY